VTGVDGNQKKATDQKIDYNVNELFIRILKVERMADKVKDFTNP